MDQERLEAYRTQFAGRETWSVEDLAEVLGRSESWVLSMLNEGKVPYQETGDAGDSGYQVKGKALAVALLESPELQSMLEEEDEASTSSRSDPEAKQPADSRAEAAPSVSDQRATREREGSGRGEHESRERIEELEAENRRVTERNRRLEDRVEELEIQLDEAISPEEVSRIREEARQEVLEKINTFSNLLAGRIEAWIQEDEDASDGMEALIELMQPSES